MKYIVLVFLLGAIAIWFGFGEKFSSQNNTMKPKLKALIIDGESNHGVWPMTTMMMKDYLQQSGLFEVDINRTAYAWLGPHYDQSIGLKDIKELLTMYPLTDGQKITAVDKPTPDPSYSPAFNDYDVVISNFGWQASDWPEETKKNFEEYMKNGGGLVIIHAADNPWGDWEEFNKMIGIGGWGGRNEDSGVHIFYDNEGNVQRIPAQGPCGSHGPQMEFMMETRAPEHPIMKGLPAKWLHAKDELYDRMCGPAENMTILATAYSDPEENSPPWNKEVKGTGRHEPVLMTIDYGKGRVFHTTLGHMDYSMEGVGFMVTFQRGAEWAATGKVTQKVPDDFPNAEAATVRKWEK